MGRNFFNRVETCFPVEDPELKVRVAREAFDTYLADNCQAWTMNVDGSYARVVAEPDERISAQERLLAELSQFAPP
jgi:polyphosphate kinase